MRVVRWTLGIVAVFLLAGMLFLFFGLNTLKGPITRAVNKSTGRELVIEGDLKPKWDLIHPRFRAEKVSFGNPDWAKEQYLLQAEAVEITLSVMPLLAGRVVLPHVLLEKPVVNLEQDEDGRKSWILEKEAEPQEESRIQIKRLSLDHGRLAYDDAWRDISVTAELNSDATGIQFATKGKYQGMPLSASGHGGPVLALRDADGEPYPLKAQAKIGETSLSVDGTINELVGFSGLDMAVTLSGKSMDDLYWIIEVALPKTSPYTTSGRLIRNKTQVRYENFTGKVGDSDLAGTFEFNTGGQRPTMTGDLRSKVVDLADLGVVVGTREPRKSGGALPDAPFEPRRWKSVNADVKFQAGTIRRPEQLPLENLSTRIRMQDAVLSLDPLEFGTAGGKLAGVIKLDGRQDTIRGDARIKVQKLQLAKLFPTVKVTQASVGDLSGAIELTGTGNSVAKLLGTSNGKIGLFMEGGEVSELVMQMVAIDLWGITRVKLKGDKQIPIRCVVGDFGVKGGVMTTNALVFDTQVVNVGGSGTINLANEQLDLTLVPEPKDGSLLSLNSPLYIRGTFSNPKAAPDMKAMAAKGLGAAALAILNPLLAVIPLLDSGKGKDSPCGELIAELSQASRSASTGRSKPPAQKSPPQPK